MFRENKGHYQNSLVETKAWMHPRTSKKLEESWAPLFYQHVFCKIDERPFAVLYGREGTPNFPVNILLSLEYIKYMKNITDAELLEGYDFDYLINYAVGNRVLGERSLSPQDPVPFSEPALPLY